MKTITAVMLAASCAACAPFHLASNVGMPAARSNAEARLDNAECKDRARIESQTAGDQARGAFLGLAFSFVGAEIDYQAQKADQRRIYRDCMEARGYTIQMATD